MTGSIRLRKVMHITRVNSKIPKGSPYDYKSIEHLKERRFSSISQ